MQVIIGILLLSGVFLFVFYKISSEKKFSELLLKLEENPDDKELKEKTIEAGRAYYPKRSMLSYFSRIWYGPIVPSEKIVDEMVKNTINN